MAKPTRNNKRVEEDPFDAFLKKEAESLLPKQPGEFTVREYMARLQAAGVKMTIGGAHSRLRGLEENGEIVSRIGRHNGAVTSFFKPVKKG